MGEGKVVNASVTQKKADAAVLLMYNGGNNEGTSILERLGRHFTVAARMY